MENDLHNIYKSAVIATFKRMIDFFESNNLEYYAAFGTALGAVRHKGIIPWDDDIDILVPRDSYNRLYEIRHQMRQEVGLDFESVYDFNSGYFKSYGKIVDINSTVWEQKNSPEISGIWIDVFPLEKCNTGTWKFDETSIVFKQKITKYRRCYVKPSFRDVVSSFVQLKWNRLSEQILDVVYYPFRKKKYHQEFVDYERSLQHDECYNWACYTNGPLCGHMYPKEWFTGYKKIPFEDFEVRVPVGNDDILRYTYGDYMTPPNPLPKYTHLLYYVNLKERLTLKEAKQRIKRGESFVF